VAAASAGILPAYAHAPKKQFRMCLNHGKVGADLDQKTAIQMAVKYGFDAVAPNPSELASMSDHAREEIVQFLKANNLTWGASSLPLDFRGEEQKFRDGIVDLPANAAVLQSVGATLMNTWIMPSNPLLTYRQNFESHRIRLKQAGNILGHYGIRLGLEYVGPKTLLTKNKYAFIRTLPECRELIAAIDEPTVGIVLDTFHWYCAGDTQADLLTLEDKDIVTVDLNDARSGFEVADQIDSKRELPMATGVIPIKPFMEALVQIGYTGPLRAEPFNKALMDMDNEMAVKETYQAMKKAFDLVP